MGTTKEPYFLVHFSTSKHVRIIAQEPNVDVESVTTVLQQFHPDETITTKKVVMHPEFVGNNHTRKTSIYGLSWMYTFWMWHFLMVTGYTRAKQYYTSVYPSLFTFYKNQIQKISRHIAIPVFWKRNLSMHRSKTEQNIVDTPVTIDNVQKPKTQDVITTKVLEKTIEERDNDIRDCYYLPPALEAAFKAIKEDISTSKAKEPEIQPQGEQEVIPNPIPVLSSKDLLPKNNQEEQKWLPLFKPISHFSDNGQWDNDTHGLECKYSVLDPVPAKATSTDMTHSNNLVVFNYICTHKNQQQKRLAYIPHALIPTLSTLVRTGTLDNFVIGKQLYFALDFPGAAELINVFSLNARVTPIESIFHVRSTFAKAASLDTYATLPPSLKQNHIIYMLQYIYSNYDFDLNAKYSFSDFFSNLQSFTGKGYQNLYMHIILDNPKTIQSILEFSGFSINSNDILYLVKKANPDEIDHKFVAKIMLDESNSEFKRINAYTSWDIRTTPDIPVIVNASPWNMSSQASET